ncbi:porin [Paraburkholderia acidisoli]|uniref:Porin n=1 Tax=Paraburkholderia acidisoli TaxID=2571748 RepID=A0A7Z2GL54_9BURK|nr:porin [Paraburkholderia acidisoli]QGZ63505.1 porin [Paraburkholderia acidisoli]
MKYAVTNRTLIFALSLGAATQLHAQSNVTLYGTVDNAISYVNNQGGHANVALRQGNLYASKFGLRGNEDLGGGTSAIFDLQAGFDANTGANSSSGLLFNRQAYAGLKNERYGTITFGRQYTPYMSFVGPLASSSWLTGATGAHPGDYDGLDTTVRINNAVTYTSPVFGGLSASVLYGFSGLAGSMGKGQTFSGALRYSTGPLSVAAGYLRLDNTERTANFDPNATGSFAVSAVNRGYASARAVQNVAAAANYTVGDFTFGLNYTNVEYLAGGRTAFADTAVFNTYGALAAWRITPMFDLAGAFSYTLAAKSNGIASAARYQQYSLKQSWHLSKRTTLYALQAYQRANGQTLGANGIVDAVATVGDSQNGTPSSTQAQFVGMAGISLLF